MPLRSTQELPTAVDAVSSVCTGETTCDALVRRCLANVERSEDEICAWQHVARQPAINIASELDGSSRKRPLAGVVVGIKDIIDTADMPTTHGSPIFEGHRPQRDAACVAALKESGAIVLGKTVTTEFAYLRPPKTSNPLDLNRTPGGSSSGSAAAVAEGMVPVALGTQTVGSLIRPAAFCGLVGFKPTFGKISTEGVGRLAESLDTVGVLARTIEDIRLIVEHLASIDPKGIVSSSPDILFASLPSIREQHASAFDVIARVQRELSARHIGWADKDFSSTVEACWRVHRTIVSFEACRNFRSLFAKYPEQVGQQIAMLVAVGSLVTAADYAAAISEAVDLRQRFDDLMLDGKVLILPSTLGEAPPKSLGTGDPMLNSPWTLLHAPTATIPVSVGRDGMPLGVQIVSRRGNDRRVLDIAERLLGLLAEPVDVERHAAQSSAKV